MKKKPAAEWILAAAILVGVTHTLDARDGEAAMHKAVQLAIPLIEKSAATYVDKRECFSCHHQALTSMVLSRARLAGFKVVDDSVSMQVRFTLEYFKDRMDRLPGGKGVPGGPYSAGYALTGLAEAGAPGNETTGALVKYLLKMQQKDGSWRIRTHRPPLEDSHFTATALAIRGLDKFGDAGKKDGPVKRALEWLDKTKAKSTEDHVFRTLGLHWGGSDKAVTEAAAALLKLQRKDHGWAQVPDMASDAYATGQALAVLRECGGLKTDSPQYLRGIQWLMDHQNPDGSWHVKTHSKPIQKFFESDFPHGRDQFISISATCWAGMALLP